MGTEVLVKDIFHIKKLFNMNRLLWNAISSVGMPADFV